MIKVVLADDHRIVRQGFSMILAQQMDMQVIGEASTPDEAYNLVSTLQPDVLVCDISMGTEKSGLLLAERIAQTNLSTKVIILSMHEKQEYLRQAFAVGALGYVVKGASDDELLKAIRKAYRGESYICESMLDEFIQQSVVGIQDALPVLSPRETEIVILAVKGYSNQDIAQTLLVSVKTVESQKTKIMNKLGLNSKPELFEYARFHGLLD